MGVDFLAILFAIAAHFFIDHIANLKLCNIPDHPVCFHNISPYF
jgi:hypothetical protein